MYVFGFGQNVVRSVPFEYALQNVQKKSNKATFLLQV